MVAFIESLNPVDLVFLVSALTGAMDLLVWTVWLSVKGGLQGEKAPGEEVGMYSRRVRRIIRASLGFMMIFGLSGMILRWLLDASTMWAILGATAAALMLEASLLALDANR